jgi:hypothetical protein
MSYRKINYDLRPAKSTERRMLVDILRRLCGNNSSDYAYIGMGSTYFTDFKLFHKELHIKRMISFEKDAGIKSRLDFNKPFKCIEVITEESTVGLSQIDSDTWAQKIIAWMDYDDPLELFMFNDISIFFSKLTAKSIYLISCSRILRDENGKPPTIESFRDRFGNLVPIDLKSQDLTLKASAITLRKLFYNKINDVLQLRNVSLPATEQLVFRPLLFLTYKDNAEMFTFGGYLDFKDTSFTLEQYNLSSLEKFIKQDLIPYDIVVPKITYKEFDLLNSRVPEIEATLLRDKQINWIPETEKRCFLELYRYLPNFMNVVS